MGAGEPRAVPGPGNRYGMVLGHAGSICDVPRGIASDLWFTTDALHHHEVIEVTE